MKQGILPVTVEVTKGDDTMTPRAGLLLVLETMLAFALDKVSKREVKVRRRQRGYPESEMIEDLVLLLAAGGDCVADINVLRADAGLCRLLGRELPSPDALFEFLYAFHDPQLIEQAKAKRKPDQVAYIPEENTPLQGLGRVNAEFVRRVAEQGKVKKATLDHDATIQESHKKQALPHYKGGRGYQPAAIQWAEQDLVVADEYRDGNVPAGMSNLPLIQKGFAVVAACPDVCELFFRADSACYEEPVLKWLSNVKRPDGPQGRIVFAISADMTKELKAVCEAVPDRDWKPFDHERAEETVDWTEVCFVPGDWPKKAEPLRYFTLRILKRQGFLFAAGFDTMYLAVVSNRDGEGDAIIRWHREKAGTIELVHDVTKNELGAGVPPSGKFGANAAWYRLSMLTYNVLSAMKSVGLSGHLSAARPKRLRYSAFTLAGKLRSHAGKLFVRVGEFAERMSGLIAARQKFVSLRPGYVTR